MCGIAGLRTLDGAPADPAAARAMAARLEHRGPDGAGEHHDGPCALAMTRLALVDPEHGRQPVRSEDGSVVAVLNGEIYDHRDHARRLRAAGHSVAPGSDAEVLVHLYEDHGPAFVRRLRGMFAIALWDARQRRLVLARDAFGIKPLCYARDGRRIAFASELQALLALADVPRDVDPAALHELLACGAVHAPRSILAGVRRLVPGEVLVADDDGVRTALVVERPRPGPVSELRDAPPEALAGELRDRLRSSVRLHLAADRPVGVLLSGGLDSGLLAALAVQEGGPLPAFTASFGERSFDEAAGARALARRLDCPHHEVRVTAGDAAALLAQLARSFDEPRADATALPYWLVCRLAARQVTAVLTGEGGDELFGGYQTYAAGGLPGAALRAAAVAAPAVAALVPSSSARLPLDFRLRRLALGAGLGPLDRHHAFKRLTDPQRVLAEPWRRAAADVLAVHRTRFEATAGAELLARLQDVDLHTFLADDLLLQADRAGMAHGLEVRVPFLDPEVAGFAAALGRRARVRGLETKRVLRAAAAPLLAPEAVRGPKRGFVAPAAAWLRGPLEAFARDVLAPAALRRQGLLDPGAVTAMLDRHAARREDLARPLWALLALTLWHDEVLARPPAAVTSTGAGTLRA